MQQSQVKFTQGFIYTEPNGEQILLGVLDPRTLSAIKADEYQRERMPNTIRDLAEDLRGGANFPVVELGLRGNSYVKDGAGFIMQDAVYTIDGLQRISAEMAVLDELPHKQILQGARLHFNSNPELERELFEVLNIDRVKLHPNVLLRNWRHKYPAIATLVKHCTLNPSFTLYNRVCWQQNKGKDHIIDATVLVKIARELHRHYGTTGSTSLKGIVPVVQLICDKIGEGMFSKNIVTFFEILDQAFGVRKIYLVKEATFMRSTFLHCVAKLFSRHQEFWRGEELYCDNHLVAKLSTFHWYDPTIKQLSGSAGYAVDELYGHILSHMNTRRSLTPRQSLSSMSGTIDLAMFKTHFSVLYRIHANEKADNGREIARTLGISQDQVYRVLHFFENAGITQHLESSIDRSSHEWLITDALRNAVESLLLKQDELAAEFFAGTDNRSVVDFQSLVHKQLIHCMSSSRKFVGLNLQLP